MYNEIGVRTNMLRSIEFRSKFVKQIQNLPEETQEGLKKVAIRFVNDENDDKCLDILWRMTYDPETALNMLGISIDNDDDSFKKIKINNYDGYCIAEEDYSFIGWSDGISFFAITSNTAFETILELAESLY